MSTYLSNVETLVVKVGTSLLTGPKGFDGRVIEDLVKDLAALKQARGLNALIVSSGAIGCGMFALGLTERPKELRLKQATAAVGQSRLVHYYETLFQTHGAGLHAAQVLLTAAELHERRNYLNIRNTINALFDMKNVVPVVNENDSVATEELRFGDNDTLAARVATSIDADLLVILSDIDGLFDKNPATHADARLIDHVENINESVESHAEDSVTQTTVGGMKTKITAARIAGAAGIPTMIANGRREGILRAVLDGGGPRTLFAPAPEAMSHRKRWIAFGRSVQGQVTVDDGARDALVSRGRSLLPAGIAKVDGEFEMGAAVQIRDGAGRAIATGLTNYSSGDLRKIAGKKSAEIAAALGRKDYDEAIHRDNLVLL